MTHYEVFWLREQQGGALGGHYGETVELEQLPINETLAGRIRALSPPGSKIQLHLPYLTYRSRVEWPSRQLGLSVKADGSTRIIVGDEAEHPYAGLLSGHRLGGATGILFQDERAWRVSDWETFVRPMLLAHQVEIGPDWKPAGDFRLQWAMELPGRHASAWATIPHRRDARFLDQFRGVSTSIQMALRAWLPFQYFAQPERYGKPQFAHPYLVYGYLPPHPSRRKTQLTFHVLEPARVVRSMCRLAKPVSGHIRRAHRRLEEGQPGQAVAGYRPVDAAEIVRSMHSLPRTFASLLSLEAFAVEEFVRFASVAHDNRHAPLRARHLVDPGLELLHNLRGRLARSYGGESYTNLANLILAAATAGLVWRDEPATALHLKISIAELGADRGIQAESRFSYANFRPVQALLPYENNFKHSAGAGGADPTGLDCSATSCGEAGYGCEADARRDD